MDTINKLHPLPALSITYDEWQKQKEESTPSYHPPRALVPVRKVKCKRRNGLDWVRRSTDPSDQRIRKKTSKPNVDTKNMKRVRHQRCQVFISTPLNTKLCLQLDSNTLVRTLRKRMARDLGLESSKLKLMMKSTQLCDALSLEDNGVVNDSNIAIVINAAGGLRGGGPDNDKDSSCENGNKLSEKELLEIASEVPDIYKGLATYLGISRHQMHQIWEDNIDSGTQQVAFVMLVKWQQSLPTSSHFRSLLASALRKCKRMDLAERVSDKGEIEFVTQCQEELKWTYLNSICHLPKYPWDETEWIDIGDIYTDLSLLVEQPRPCQPLKVPLKNQDEVFTHVTVSGGPSTRIIIQREAGTGKSTLTVKYVYDWARQDTEESSPIRKFKLVFLLRMRHLDESSNLEEAIVKHLLPQDTKITASQLRSFIEDHPEECCVILDGYDEFRLSGSASESTERSIVQMINNSILRKCFLILSSRSAKLAALGTHLKEYKQFEVRGFSSDNIKKYIRNFFGEENNNLATSLIDYLESNNLDAGFAAAPLITRLLCLYWLKDAESGESGIEKSLFSVSSLHDALFEFLEEHYFNKNMAESDFNTEKLIVDLGLGRVALKSLWPPNNKLVFTWDEMAEELLSDETVRKACEIGLLHRQQASRQSKGPRSKRRSSLSSWKKVTTVEFFHKSAQEKCAGEYLAHLGDNDEDEFRTMMQGLRTSKDALIVKMILLFACGRSRKTAMIILRHLTELFRQEFHQDMGQYFKGELHFERARTIQDMIDLCLMCNVECEPMGNLSSELLNLFSDGRITFSGITPQRASALSYFLSNVPSPDVIKKVTVIGVPRKGSFFVPSEIMESTSDKAFHDYVEIYSKLSSQDLQEKLQQFASDCSEAYRLADTHGIPTTLAAMQMWQVFEDWQKEVHLSLNTFIHSLKNVTIEQLIFRSVPLGFSSSILWQLMKDKELQELTFLNLRQTGLGLEDISKLAECVHLLPNLKHLDICQNEQAGNALDRLSESLTSVDLEVLDVYMMWASPATMKKVHRNLPKFAKQLQVLYLHCNEMDEEGAKMLAESLIQLTKLTFFSLPHLTQHKDVVAMQQVLGCFKALPHLTDLCLTPGSLHVQVFLSIVASEMPNWASLQSLRVYTLKGCDDTIDERHSQEFAQAVAKMSKLHTLKLHSIRLTVQSFGVLVENARKKKCQKLIWICRNFLPEDYTTPDDDFITIL